MKKRKLKILSLLMITIFLFQFYLFALEEPEIFEEFNSYNNLIWIKSDGWSNGSIFDCTWRKDNIFINDGVMEFNLTNDWLDAHQRYAGSEYQTKEFYGYGLYEVSMKPAKKEGVVTSFFTYTGAYFNDPWDEIDIEFIGKDTNSVQFNYFTNGVGNHEYIYELGFDASEDFHKYSFDWQKDLIIWYVDDEEVYRATSNIPQTPGKIIMNLWPGIGVDAWLGHYDGSPTKAYYNWVKYYPSNIDNPSDVSIDYEICNIWETGAVINVTIKNDSSKAIDNWNIKWEYVNDEEIKNIWNAEFVQEDNRIAIDCAQYNKLIPPNGSVSFGLQISHSNNTNLPINFALNNNKIHVNK